MSLEKYCCFDVRSGMGTVNYDGNFTDVIDTVCRIPKKHAGWLSVRYKGSRYRLFGGIRTNLFISICNPIVARI